MQSAHRERKFKEGCSLFGITEFYIFLYVVMAGVLFSISDDDSSLTRRRQLTPQTAISEIIIKNTNEAKSTVMEAFL